MFYQKLGSASLLKKKKRSASLFLKFYSTTFCKYLHFTNDSVVLRNVFVQ